MNKTILILSLLLNIVLAGVLFYAVNRLGGVNHILFRIKNGGIAGTHYHRTKILNKLPITEKDIVFLGNSITEQGEWREFLGNNDIKNRGIGGDFTQGVLDRLPKIIEGKPRKLFLMIGVNDLIQFKPAFIIANYRKIVETIRANSENTELYLQSILPVNPIVKDIGLKNEDIKAINQGIQALAKELDLPYIDLHSMMIDDNGNLDAKFTKDGIHINDLAYEIWVNRIRPLVEK